MRFQDPSRERTDDALFGDDSEDRAVHDERKLYGEPCHEVERNRDEQTLYGEPQHETPEDNRELPDIELLFARLRTESTTGPTVVSAPAGNSQMKTTEQ